MPDYCFLKKGRQIAVLERSDAEGTSLLNAQGYEKHFEEVSASNAESALARLAEIRKEEVTTEHAFITGSKKPPLIRAKNRQARSNFSAFNC